MYQQREKEKDHKKITKAHTVIRKKAPQTLEDDPFAHLHNGLLQRQDKARISPFAPNPVNRVDPMESSYKEGKSKEDDLAHPEEGLKPVSIMPIEWAIEGISDVADTLAQMVETGPTLALAATLAVNLIPGKAADKVIKLELGKKGSWNKALNGKLKENATYKVGQYTYKTDEFGRVNSVSGKPDLSKRDRNQYQQTKAGKVDGIKDGFDDDEGGHLIASIFDGPGEQINYAAMDGNLNKGAWKSMENDWAKALRSDPPKEVEVEIRSIYENDSKRPSSFDVFYEIDGVEEFVSFKNKPGG